MTIDKLNNEIMTRDELFAQIQKKRSFLCVGLDTDVLKFPQDILRKNSGKPITSDLLFKFNRDIIEATAPYTVCYKLNLAFYEIYLGVGMNAISETIHYIKENYPEIFIIADAKRGDIKNTSEKYAKAFLDDDRYSSGSSLFDAVTLSPYMGRDTVDPFLAYKDKWAVILALTSNESAKDFETLELANGRKLYEQVLETSKEWGTTDNIMYVVGATRAETLKGIREIVPDHFLLVPGVGEQGGSLQEVAEYGLNEKCGLLVNSSRGIIYADNTERFAEAAAEKAREIQQEMEGLLRSKGLI